MDELEKLYAAVSQNFDIGSLEDFKAKMSTQEDRRRFYDVVSQRFDIGDYDSYERRLGGAQEVSAQGSAGTSQISGQPSGSLAEPLQGNNIEPNEEIGQAVAQAEASVLEKVGNQYGDMYIPEGTEVVTGLQTDAGQSVAVRGEDGEIYNVIPEVSVKPPELAFTESVTNTAKNIWTRLQGFDDRMKLVSADTWENILGKEAARAFYNFSFFGMYDPRDIDEVRSNALSEIERLENETRRTRGIIETLSKGDLVGFGASVLDAMGALVSTAVTAGPMGVGLIGDMTGQALYDHNSQKADELGLTIDELYEQGKSSYSTPIMFGVAGGLLERVGYKGAQKAVMDAFNSSSGKAIGRFMFGGNKEGITEWLQTGLEAANITSASDDSTIEDMTKSAVGTMFSKEGAEAYLMGTFGALGFSGLSHVAGRAVRGKEAKGRVDDILSKIEQSEQALQSPNLNPITREVIEGQIESGISSIVDEVQTEVDLESTLTTEQRNDLEAMFARQDELMTVLDDPNLIDGAKDAIRAELDEVSSNIDKIISDADNVSPVATETDSGAQSPVMEESGAVVSTQTEVVSEETASEGQYFTRDIGGEQTVYRRNGDGTASIVTDAEAQQILNRPAETTAREDTQVEGVSEGATEGVQQTEVSIAPEQAETVNTALQEQGFTPEESTSFLQDIRTEEGRSNRKQAAADRIRQYWQSQQNLGIASRQDPEEFARFIRDVAEYAAVSILDGSIRTAKGLAKAIGVTYDENIQRAFEQAQAIVQPIQEATVTPPRTTTKGQIRRATQGGIQGKVTLTNRQALKTQIQTLNRGIREGRKQITESRKEITDFIKGMKEAGLFRGKVRGSVVNALINRVNKANTPAQLRNALDYAEKASRIIDYDQKLSTANTLKSRAKRLAKRKGIPADLVPVLKGMGGINPRYIDNIVAFNEQLAELISAVDGAGIDGIEQTQHRDLITSVKNKIEQARIQALKDQLIDAGMESNFVDALNTMNQLLEAVANLPDESKPSGESKREFRERIYEQTKELLRELDRTELSPQQSAALDALLGIDVSQVSDQMMATIAVVGKNAAVNQSFAGAGPIIAEYRLQQETSNQKNVDKVKSTVRIASRIGKAVRERFGTVIAQIDAVMRDQQAVSAFYALTGFGDILEGSTRYGHRAEGVKKIVEDLSKKHAKDLSDSVQSAMYAMYADLNQYKNTWTEEQRVEEFNKRKEAIQTSIDRIEEQMGRDKHFEAQQRDYLSNVKKAWEQVKSAKHPDEIYEKLNNGFKAAYSEMRGFYDSILPEMQDNALIHNNTDLDTDWVNYFPRSYKKLGRPATERKIEQIEEMAGSMGIPLDDIVNQGESSGAKQNRVITGAQLPANATINFDAFNSFYDSSLRALYDIETQPARQYAARALNSGRVAEIFGDATPLEIFRNATIQKISNDQLGLYGGPTSRFRSALRAMSTWGTRLALGGVGQVVKQSIPQMSDTVVRLGNNAHLMAAGLNGYLKYNDLLNEAIKDQPVSRRNVATIERQTSVINKRELNEIRRGLGTGVLRGLGIADKVVEAVSLSSLKWGDDMAAKASWLAFYLEYKKRNGETVVDLASELQNPSKDAKAYATQRVELTNNVSDPSLRANTSKHIGSEMLAVIAPFSSFAINAKLELATTLGRLRELGGMNNQERLRTARNIGGNVANILAYNVIGKTIRNIMIGGTASLAYALLNNDDWDEDDEKAARELIDTWESDAIARNEENSMEYLVNDLVFGGIAEQSLQPGIDVVKDLYAKAKGEQPKERFARPRTIYDALGIFGIPARTAGRFFNDLSEWTMTDAEWQMRKFSIEDAWGETRYVPLEYRGINRPIFSRKGFGLTTLAHGVALTGASSQEVSALANRIPSLISQIETKLHGRDRKDKLAENESLRKIKVAGQTKELTEEQWEWAVNERRKFLEEVETSDRFVTLQKDELASKVGDELSEEIRRKTATEYARAKAIVEFNLVDGVGEKIAEDAKKKASDIISAADLWKKQLNPNTYPKQEQ